MKKFKKIRIILFSFIFATAFCLINTNVYAKTVTPDEIQGPAYVIGTHVFTRSVNETTGYDGKLTTNLIMLASKTIKSGNLDSMIIYYKTASGMWINGLTGSPIDTPESFEINYTNIQLEEENSTVSAPKTPIVSLHESPLSIVDKKTDMLSYQLAIYVDDIDDKTNETDGVELDIVDYNSDITHQDLKYSDSRFIATSTVLDNYTGDDLVIGKKYHSDVISFENKIDGYYTITARAYVEDGNGKKIYSDSVYLAIKPNTTLPTVEIVNNYSNPDYVTFDETTYTYKLTIKKPNAYVFKTRPEKFAYIVHEKKENGTNQIGVFGINDSFTVEIPKDTVKTYYAQLGYYDKDGNFKFFATTDAEQKYFTIDTRKTITTPVLNSSNGDYSDIAITYGDIVNVNSAMYSNADEDTLDHMVKGVEIYQINYDGTNMSNFKYVEPMFNETDSFLVRVKPKNGMATYVARAYATNSVGQKIYSKYSNVVTVIRTPEIEVSDISDGKVNVSIKNIEEYGTAYDLKYKVFNASGTELTGLVKLNKASSINIDSTTQLYIRIYKVSDDSGNTHSAESNRVDVVVE